MKYLRKEYTKSSLEIETMNADPVSQFNLWFQEAVDAGVPEPNAMNLATVSEDGRPTSRMVLLKGVEQGKFLFYTNHQSQKGRAMEKNPACALNFFWHQLERQVRIEGMTSPLPPAIAEAYFQSRPRQSQLGAWASPQSAVIASRALLEERMKEIEERFKGQEVLPKPNQWGGYAVEAFRIEFWQGRRNRLHDRIVYTLRENGWKVNRLAP